MDNNRDEQMIYLKDLLFATLYRWKTVLAAAVILALILGAMQGISGWKVLSNQDSTTAGLTELEFYQQKKALLEQKLELAQQSVADQQTYLDHSLLMQLDPNGYYEVSVTLCIQTDYQILPGMTFQNTDKTDAVVSAYAAVVTGNDCVQALATAMNSESQYVDAVMSTTTSSTADTLNIKVKTVTEEAANAVLTSLTQQVQAAHDQVSTAITSHTVTILEQAVSLRADMTLADTQKKENARVLEYLTAVELAQAELGSLVVPATATTNPSAVVKKVVVFSVLGMVIGAFLTMCVIWVLHIVSDRVYSARTLSNHTGVKVIGSVLDSRNNLLLKKCEGRNVTDAETQLATLAVDIRCRARDAKHLMVVGTANTDGLVQALTKELTGVRIDAGNILDGASALNALNACDTVVLVAQCGVSYYSTVLRQTEIICDYEKQLLGCVLIGG